MQHEEGLKDVFRKTKEKNIEQAIMYNDIVIFGAGNTALLYSECFETEKINIKFFCDNNKEKQGKTFMGKEVIDPRDINKRCSDPLVLILSMNPKMCYEIQEQCRNLGIMYAMFDAVIFLRHETEIMENFYMLDSVSQKIYSNIIISRMTGSEVMEEDVCRDRQYFCIAPFLRYKPGEVFVDCGAFVGDTVERYIWNKTAVFDRIYAFEPNKKNYDAMCRRIKRLNEEWGFPDDKITPVFAGVGDRNRKVFVENESDKESSTTTRIRSDGSGEVDMYSLDGFFGDRRVGFIKADIEGFEKNMIQGAKNLISRDRPSIAVCIYHSADDMYGIMQLLKNYNPEYKFAVRHHSYEYCETVLYAW